MAIAYDTVGPSATGQTASSPATITWSHTCSGSQRALIAMFAVGQNSGSDAAMNITGVTYAGTAMTSLGVHHANNDVLGYFQFFGLVNPASGANNVVGTFNTAPSNAECGSLSFTGVDQTTPFGTAVLAAGFNTNATVVVGTNTSGNLIAYGAAAGSGLASTATSPATKRWLNNLNTSSGAGCGGGATIPATGASVTCAWTVTASDLWAIGAVEVRAAAGGTVAFEGWGIPA